MEKEEAIKLWNELSIVKCVAPFTCGGDSMGDIEFQFYDEDGNTIESSKLEGYFDREVYNNVEFYVDTDGHYLGESGEVIITIDDEDEDDFNYYKNAMSEYSERNVSVILIPLSDDELKYISENVNNINGNFDGIVINYKREFILSDTDEEIEQKLRVNVLDACNDYAPDSYNGELQDWRTFTTHLEADKVGEPNVIIENNSLKVEVDIEVIVRIED